MQALPEVALYLRVSTQEQVDTFSLDAQEAALRSEAKRQGKRVYKIYRDAGISGYDEGRAALNELLRDAKKGCFSEVLVWTVSRVARKLSYLLNVIEELKQYGVTLRSLSENFDADSPTGKMVLSTMGAIAEMQRASWMESSRIGTQRRTKEGGWSGGIPLGYTVVPNEKDLRGGRLEIVPGEAQVVNEIFCRYAEGLGYKAIVNCLNAEGKATKEGKEFAVGSVKAILTNRLYIGKVEMGGVQAEGLHEPIISRQLWQTVQARLQASSRPVRKIIDREYLLSGVIRCPVCGSGMLPAHSKSRRKDGTFRMNHYYNCGAYMNRGKAACRANSVRADEAEEKVLAWLLEILSSPFWAKRVAETIQQRQAAEQAPQEAERTEVNEKISSIAQRQKELLAAYENGRVERDIFLAEAQALKATKEGLTARLSVMGNTETSAAWTVNDVQASFRAFRKVLAKSTAVKKRELVRALVGKVLVNEKRQVVELELKVSLPARANRDTALVLPIKRAE